MSSNPTPTAPVYSSPQPIIPNPHSHSHSDSDSNFAVQQRFLTLEKRMDQVESENVALRGVLANLLSPQPNLSTVSAGSLGRNDTELSAWLGSTGTEAEKSMDVEGPVSNEEREVLSMIQGHDSNHPDVAPVARGGTEDLLSDWMNLDEPNSNMQSMDVSFDSVDNAAPFWTNDISGTLKSPGDGFSNYVDSLMSSSSLNQPIQPSYSPETSPTLSTSLSLEHSPSTTFTPRASVDTRNSPTKDPQASQADDFIARSPTPSQRLPSEPIFDIRFLSCSDPFADFPLTDLPVSTNSETLIRVPTDFIERFFVQTLRNSSQSHASGSRINFTGYLCRLCSEQQTGKPILFAHNISPEALQKHCKDEHIGEWTLFRAGWGDLDA